MNAYSAVCGVYPSNINGQASIQKKGTYSIPNLPSYATVTWNLPSQDTNAISISVTGEGNNECTIELNGEKQYVQLLLQQSVLIEPLLKH